MNLKTLEKAEDGTWLNRPPSTVPDGKLAAPRIIVNPDGDYTGKDRPPPRLDVGKQGVDGMSRLSG